MTPLDALSVPLSGTTLIEASAGTGKTYTIATLFVRLLVERGLEVREILVVTYTRAAASELRDRIRNTLARTLAAIEGAGSSFGAGEPLSLLVHARADRRDQDRLKLQNALRDFDEAAISTMHAFCQRVLTECAFESRTAFELTLLEDDRPVIHEATLDYLAHASFERSSGLAAALAADDLKADKLLKLATEAVRAPDMPVLPDPSALPDLPQAAFEAACTEAGALWRAHREELIGELTVPDRLYTKQFAPEVIRREYGPVLDCLESVEEPPKWFGYLTPAGLQKHAYVKGPGAPRHRFFDVMGELVAAHEAIKETVKETVIGVRRQLVDYVRRTVTARHRQHAVQSFDELLRNLDGALRSEQGDLLVARMSKRYLAALVDEFQDTDPVQYSILARLYRGKNRALFLVGDPKQAIYRFRGADIFAYLEAARTADTVRTLDVSHRADPRLLTALNTLYGRACNPFLHDGIRFERVSASKEAKEHLNGERPALQILFVPRTERTKSGWKEVTVAWSDANLPRLVANEIARLLRDPSQTLEGRRLEPRDFAVLCRTNAQARATQAELAQLNVLSVLDGDSSVLQSATADDLARVLWAIARPADTRSLGAALAGALFGLSADELHALRGEGDQLELWLERFARYNQLWQERGFMQMLQRLLDDKQSPVYSRLLRRPDGERRLTDLLHLGELLHRASLEQHLGPLALLHWLEEMRQDADEGGALAPESAQVRLEHDDYALRLTTIHRSKGLEYPIVFCPFLWAGVRKGLVSFHDPEDSERIKLDLGSDDLDSHKEIAEQEELAENLRLVYVALTRARHRCYMVWGAFTGSRTSPLAHLLHGDGQPRVSLKDLGARFADKSDDDLRAELEELCDASDDTIGVRDILPEGAPHYDAQERASGHLCARASKRKLSQLARMSSFSRLCAHAESAPSRFALEGVDRDEDEALLAEPSAEQAPVVLHDFPAGARAGTLVHAVYEHIDFMRADAEELPREVARLCSAFGYAPELLAGPLARGIDASLRTPLDSSGLSLAAVSRRERLDELEFTLSTPDAPSALSTSTLADVFERFDAPAPLPGYHERLRALKVEAPSGFLKGFIDLVFRRDGRYFIADYKSNRLGATERDYGPPAMLAAMTGHNYVLQYHLYTVALHRHLRERVAGYEYERHFGGVYYLFVRGMAPEHAPGTGIFFDRPSLPLVQALGAVLGCKDPA